MFIIDTMTSYVNKLIVFLSMLCLLILFELCVSVSSETTVHFMYGENVTLTCPVNNSMGIVSWIKDITPITDDKSDINPALPCDKKYSVFSNDSCATMLHINMAEDCVVGKYWCETLADGDFQRFSILLKKVELPTKLRILNADSKHSVHGTESIPLDLICKVINGTTKEKLSWIFNDTVLASNHSLDSVKHTITPDRTFDCQVFTCQADSTYMKTLLRRNITLNIDYPPDVLVTGYNNGTLFCNATGNPDIYKYSRWEHRSSSNKHIRYLDGRQNGYLLIPNLNGLPWFWKSGSYTCSAENGITNNHRLYRTGSENIEFEGTPACIRNDYYGYGILGEQSEIFIEVYSVPKYNDFHWKSSNVTISNTSTKYVMKVTKTQIETVFNDMQIQVSGWKFALIVYDLIEDDFDYFTLQILNDKGNTSCTFSLKHGNERRLSPTMIYIIACGSTIFVVLVMTAIKYIVIQRKTELRNIRKKPVTSIADNITVL